MSIVKIFHARRSRTGQLLQQAGEQVFDLLLVLAPEVAVDIRDASAFILKLRMEVVDYNCCDDCLPRPGNARTKQRLLVCIQPRLELVRVQKPLAGSWLSHADEVVVLTVIVGWSKPGKDFPILLIRDIF